jgi:hypothetical protein
MVDTTTQAAPTIRQRVEAGAAWLTEHRPGWLNRIDLITLDLGDPVCCVLVQEYGDFANSPLAWNYDDEQPAADLGFDQYRTDTLADDEGQLIVPFENARRDYAELTEAWKAYVLDEAARVAAACCPCRDTICNPGCGCPDCPHSDTEITDDDN